MHMDECVWVSGILKGHFMNQEDILHLRRKIAEEYEAIKGDITDQLPGDAKHALLDNRMQRIDIYYTQLASYLGEQQANQIICEIYMQIIG
jgi:hypothetical protein